MTTLFTRTVRTVAFALAAIAISFTAQAQTTLRLDAPATQVTDVTIGAGASAPTNFNGTDSLATSATTDYDQLRRALLKFDTQNTIAAKSVIQSAVMTLTLKAGGADVARDLTVFPVTLSWVQEEANWSRARSGSSWMSAGGDFGPAALVQRVPNVAGAKVTFDLTALVRAAVSGTSASRYTRVALVDLGAATAGSSREFFSSEALDPSVRPVLTVVYGGAQISIDPAPVVPPTGACSVGLDKAALSVGQTEANWIINVATAATCAWTATSDASWLVVKSTSPATATGNGYAKIRAVANTVSATKRTGHVTINGAVYTVAQSGCGTTCTGDTTPVVNPPVGNPVILKVLQYNTHHGGYGTDGVYSMDRIADWIVKSGADLVSLNEIEKGDSWSKNQDQAVLYRQLMETRTNQTWYMAYVNAHAATTGPGNIVLSKFPIIGVTTHLLSGGRAAVDAMVDVNGRTINFISTHMDNVSETNRLTETAELLPWALGLAE